MGLHCIRIELKPLASPRIPKPELKHHQLAHCKQEQCGPNTRKSNIIHMNCRWESETVLKMGRAVRSIRYGEDAGCVEELTRCASTGETT